jgi:hypothetical protein
MPKYIITIERRTTYATEADSEQEAIDCALYDEGDEIDSETVDVICEGTMPELEEVAA